MVAGRKQAGVRVDARRQLAGLGRGDRGVRRRGEPKKLTDLATEASGVRWSPDGRWIAFTSDVYPECTTPRATRGS